MIWLGSSERIRQLLESYLQGGYEQSEQSVSEFVKLAVPLIARGSVVRALCLWSLTVAGPRRKIKGQKRAGCDEKVVFRPRGPSRIAYSMSEGHSPAGVPSPAECAGDHYGLEQTEKGT